MRARIRRKFGFSIKQLPTITGRCGAGGINARKGFNRKQTTQNKPNRKNEKNTSLFSVFRFMNSKGHTLIE
jgi:hypothetical protein